MSLWQKTHNGGRGSARANQTQAAPTKRHPPLALLSLCAITAATVLMGCKEESRQSTLVFDGQKAFTEVEALVAFSPRDAGTEGGLKAAHHLKNRLDHFGLETVIDSFKDQTPAGEKTFHNVMARIQGKTDEWIILGSHFDTMPGIENFQGANDGGSSTGVLLEIARLMANEKPDVGIIFAFFDGEEGIADYVKGDGLHGSRHLAQTLVKSGEYKKMKAMILLDMVGDPDLHFTIPVNSTRGLVKEVLDAAHATGYRDYFSLSRDMMITDDHVPFQQLGIPAIDLIDFRYGSAPGLNDYWHTSADHLENISAQSLEITGKITVQIIRQIAYSKNTD